MELFLQQIQASLEEKLYYLALYTSLTIPDICSALESDNGEAEGKKYKQWYDKYMLNKYRSVAGEVVFSADDCWYFRCSILHQGSSIHTRSTYK
jgi:hypothetical protein